MSFYHSDDNGQTFAVADKCSSGVYDCKFEEIPDSVTECAHYNHDYLQPDKLDWCVGISCGVGARTRVVVPGRRSGSWALSPGVASAKVYRCSRCLARIKYPFAPAVW